MKTWSKSCNAIALLAATALGIAGCTSDDKPPEYGRQRPPIDQLDERDRGLQSKDLIAATDQMAMELLSLPDLNESRTQWTIVASNVENETVDARENYDIFIDRLRTSLGKHGRGRITLIENRERYRRLQNKELEPGAGEREDEFGQTGRSPTSGGNAGPAGVQPDFILYGKMQELPNRATSLYRAEFNLTNLKNRVQVWTGEYMVKVER
jgi:hypothetical protein